MIVAGSASPLLLSSAGGYNLTKSLRFRSSASAFLNRTPASNGSLTTWTFSTWVKLGEISTSRVLLAAGLISGTIYYNRISINSDGSLGFWNYPDTGPSGGWINTANLLRDPSAWYHLVFVWNTTSATSTDRMQIYINGTRVTNFITNVFAPTYPAQNTQSLINSSSYSHRIGRTESGQAGGNFLDGYLAEVNFIDGQALTPSSFGQTSPTTGVWQPRRYTGTYGTNGFYLPFTDVATTSGSNAGLGKDFSGNGNYWTTNNISVTSGSTYDSMKDVPTLTDADTANYCTLNPLASRSVGTMQNGNLTWKKSDAAGDNYCCASSISIPSSGKWYWEVTVTDGSSGANSIGIIPNTSTTQQTANTIPGDFGITTNAFGYYSDGNKLNAGSSAAYGNSFTSGDVIAVAVDTTNGKIWWSKNGTWQASGDPAAGTNAAFTTLSGSYYAASSVRFNGNQHDYNFGQRPFAYTPPTGFKALNTFNLPTPTIGATASTTANKYFDALLYTGNGSASQRTDISWANMQPDMVWIKNRTSANNHVLHDDIRGTNAALQPNLTNATDSPVGFGTDGFGFDGVANQLRIFTSDGRYNTNGNAYVTWGWKGSGAAGVTNTAGSITSTVSANTTAGFSIVTYTGSGAAGTVGHGLGVAPAMIITKNRTTAGNSWVVWHKGLSGAYSSTTGYIYLDQTAAAGTTTNFYDGTAMTSTTFRWQGGNINVNSTSNNYVSYCFSEVAGYSAFGSYTGNGSSDGPFVFTGFRPRYVLIKASGLDESWFLYDSARNTYNVVDLELNPNNSGAEATFTTLDFVSNGFKIRNTNSLSNQSGATYIYMAFAEFPQKFSLAR